ncbi:hypothetical protein BK634_30440 [Pseudomonas chlororaphis]|jgi:hypothetical protein|nr:hypothetical protein BK634_30440 [Pseudomonas chlororaphis]WEK09046.1 MAG: DUF3592 domain-containing protein [Pseudomonas sp.]
MAHSSQSRWLDILRSLFISLVGIVLLVIAGYLLSNRLEFLDNALTADGVVSGLNAGGSHPEIAFTSAQGEQISYPQGGFIFGYQTGQPVKVHYLAERPANSAVIDDRMALWATPGVVGGMGLIFLGAGLLGIFKRKGQRPARSLKGL